MGGFESMTEIPPKIQKDGHAYYLSRCPGCQRKNYRRHQNVNMDDRDANGVPIGRTRCRSCGMRGRQNRGPGASLQDGYEYPHKGGINLRWQGHWIRKERHIVQEALGIKLSRHDKVLFLDGNSMNFDPVNLAVKFVSGEQILVKDRNHLDK